jgi:hypothetical protein
MSATVDRPPKPPVALTIALVVVLIEAVAEIAALFVGDPGNDQSGFSALRGGPGGLAILASVIGCKIVFAVRTRQLKAGSALGLLALESVGMLAAVASQTWTLELRVLVAVTVVTVFGLVLSSLHAFPTPVLPRTPSPAGETP